MTTHLFEDNKEELDMATLYIKATIRLIVKFLELIPTFAKSFDEAYVEPELYLIDENVAIAMCCYELMHLLQNAFGKNFRALKFFC